MAHPVASLWGGCGTNSSLKAERLEHRKVEAGNQADIHAGSEIGAASPNCPGLQDELRRLTLAPTTAEKPK
jgi:hypothetical protein